MEILFFVMKKLKSMSEKNATRKRVDNNKQIREKY